MVCLVPFVVSWTGATILAPESVFAMSAPIYRGGPPFNSAYYRFPNDVAIPLQGAGAPTNGTSGTGAGASGPGSVYINISNGDWYFNSNTKASPTWTAFGSTAGAATPTSVVADTSIEAGTTLTVGTTSTLTGAVEGGSSIKSTSPSGGIGYATGAGVAATQGTSRTTTVVGNGVCGSITLFSAAGSATPFSFTFTNSAIAATDVVMLSQKSGTDKYTTQVVSAVGAGSCQITLANAAGTTTETPVFNFVVIKAVAA